MLGPIPGYSMKPAFRAPRPLEGDQTANQANSTSPSSASLSNTAAGYTTLGGRWQFAAVAGAATDYALFAYQVPSTHRLLINGVWISTVNTGAAVATTAHILDWSLGLDSTAVSLATADSDPAYGPRRVPLGMQAFLSGAAIGAVADDVVRRFTNPLIVKPGRFVHVILQMPVATATGSQVLRGDVTFDGWFEPTDDSFKG
jgi:hypothetical protein